MSAEQRALLENAIAESFEARCAALDAWPILAGQPRVMQMNLGYVCNQRCRHCHLEAGPERTEQMLPEVMEQCLEFAARAEIIDFDLTGGAPELHPRFRWLVAAIREQGGEVTDRCNLTILSEPGQEDLAEFLAANEVRIMASLPHYSPEMTERIRGREVFDRSIAGLRVLNALGYGQPGGTLELTLVHSPAGAVLPGSQAGLEAEFRTQLRERHGIEFTRLVSMTNIPSGRFLRFLADSGNLGRYMRRLAQQFNPCTLEHLMCRDTLSIGWDGTIYDCDFNQSLGIPVRNGHAMTIDETTADELDGRVIRCENHCYGCTAGQGSSCGGAVA